MRSSNGRTGGRPGWPAWRAHDRARAVAREWAIPITIPCGVRAPGLAAAGMPAENQRSAPAPEALTRQREAPMDGATIITGLTLVAALGAGIVAGVFFAFSTFVMKALSRLPAPEGVAAMQSINVAVINPMFLGVFLGTAAVSLAAAVVAVARWQRPGAEYLLSGGLLYLVGTFGVTIAFNVPLNNSLAAVSPGDAGAAAQWASYTSRWTAWNHVRTAAAVGAMVLLALRT